MATTVQDLLAEITRIRGTPGATDCYTFSLHEILAIYRYLEENLELRAERVELQGENESLRHDLKIALADGKVDERFTYSGATGDTRTHIKGEFRNDHDEKQRQLDEMAETLRPVKTEADIAALAERLAKVEDRLSAVFRDHEKYIEQVARDVHKRIDHVVALIGTRIDQLFTEAREADSANGELMHSLQRRIILLEDLAKTRGERLDSLEERQHQDDLDRAAGEGMAKPPHDYNFIGGRVVGAAPMEETLGQLTGIDGLDAMMEADARRDAEARADEYPVVRPTHENGQQRHTFTVPEGMEAVRDAEGRATGELRRAFNVGDEVRLEGAATSLDRRLSDGWWLVSGIGTSRHFPVQVKPIEYPEDKVRPIYWIEPSAIKEIRHGR